MTAAGGFIPFSPPPSSVASSNLNTPLPQPRRLPLKAGGTKESNFIRYVDQKILNISRRFAKRDLGATGLATATSEEWYDVPGYSGFGEAAAELDQVVEVIWVSGTPSLQVPYLINLALLTSTMIPAFPAAPKPLFRLLGKLDYAFASLIQQRDFDTGHPLPGFSMRLGISGTEKVRIKSLVERTRVCVVDVMTRGEFDDDDDNNDNNNDDDDTKNASIYNDEPDTDLEGDLILEGSEEFDLDEDVEDDNWDMKIAKVYDRTLVALGETMDGPEIGIRTG